MLTRRATPFIALLLSASLMCGGTVLPWLGGTLAGNSGIAIDSCDLINKRRARLRCDDKPLKEKRSLAQLNSRAVSEWRLVRSPNPSGGAAANSMMRTANISASDPDFAGLVLRCGEKTIEVLVVVVTPFPPEARPKVTILDPDHVELDGTIVPPGAAVLLPAEATALASGPWQRHSSLTVVVDYDKARIRGVVPLDGLAAAMKALTAECQRR